MSNAESRASQEPTNVEKLRGLPWGVAWSVTNSVFAHYTFFGSVFVLYLAALGLDKSQMGGLLSLLPFLGVIAVFVASPVARLGHKRVFNVSMAARTATAILLMVAPVVLARFGLDTVLAFMILIVAAFGLFRAVAFTAFYPWQQEQVPDAMRGKYTAIKNTLASLAALLAMLAAGYILGPDPGLGLFVVLIGVGVLFGIISVWTSTRIPGGAPSPMAEGEQSSYRGMVATAQDPNFVRYLLGVGLVTLSTVPLLSFVPLFMNEVVGLQSDQVVWLEIGILLGALASGYLWGWLADRYGSKPVMVWSVYLLPLLPLAWLVMPRDAAWAVYLAFAIAIAQGLIDTGWIIGSGRLLYVRVVPVQMRTTYMAVYFAWMGIAGGLGQLMGGWLVDTSAGLQGQWWIFKVDAYTPLFLVGITFPPVAILLLRRVQADSSVTAAQFAGMFLRGNPLLAFESLLRYSRARDERATVAMTERLGSTRSPLTVEELLEALHDPRFFVRFEAIVSIARHGPEGRLIDALIETLEGNDPSLSTIAAWGLGRMADDRALEALRRGLDARYRSVQAHCARSLGSLDDRSVLPILLDRLAVEQDVGLQLAYASTLGKLGATEATCRLLDLLRAASSIDVRRELAFALARLVGDEHHFIQVQRKAESDPGTVFSQEVTALKGKLVKAHQSSAEMEQTLDQSALAFARDDLSVGAGLLRDALRLLPEDLLEGPCATVIRECVAQMDAFGAARTEYLLLAFQAFDCGLRVTDAGTR